MEVALSKLPAAEQDTLREAIKIYRAGNPIHNPDLLMPLGQRILGESSNVQGAECMSCHPSPSELTPVWNGLHVSHSKHLIHGLTCRKCHDPEGTPHGKLVLTMSECSSCHHGSFGQKVGTCATCHPAQANTFAGKVQGFDEVPATMYEAELQCTDCHAVKDNHVSKVVSPTCVECHDKDYATTFTQWVQFGDSLLTAGEAELKKLRPGSDDFKKYSDLVNALHADRSHTVHNPDLFNQWKDRLNSAQ
jgi:hypothetical protein